MRPLFRHLFTFCCAASLAECLVVVALWVVTWGNGGVFRISESPTRSTFIASEHGRMRFVVQRAAPESFGYLVPFTAAIDRIDAIDAHSYLDELPARATNVPTWRFMGFGYRRDVVGWWLGPYRDGAIATPGINPVFRFDYVQHWLPHWFLTLATGVAPAVWIYRRQRRTVARTTTPATAHSRLKTLASSLATLASAGSLLLCLAACALWVRSYLAFDIVQRAVPAFSEYDWSFRSVCGRLEGSWNSHSMDGPPVWEWEHFDLEPESPYRHILTDNDAFNAHVGPFVLDRSVAPEDGMIDYTVAVPMWFHVALFAALPAWRITAALRARRRQSSGLCPTCGYDLRGSPAQCPECGTARK